MRLQPTIIQRRRTVRRNGDSTEAIQLGRNGAHAFGWDLNLGRPRSEKVSSPVGWRSAKWSAARTRADILHVIAIPPGIFQRAFDTGGYRISTIFSQGRFIEGFFFCRLSPLRPGMIVPAPLPMSTVRLAPAQFFNE